MPVMRKGRKGSRAPGPGASSKKPRTKASEKPELHSLRGYSDYRRALGLPHSLSTIQAAIRSGRISRICSEHERCPVDCSKGKIDPTIADLEWAAWTDTRSRPPDEKDPKNLREAQLMAMTWRARLDRQRWEERNRILVRRDDVQSEIFRQVRTVRDHLMALPRRLAGQLAVETDRKVVEQLIDRATREALSDIDEEKLLAMGK